MPDISIIKRFIRTEKSSILKQKENVYEFEVDLKANKIEIKKAVAEQFKVRPEKIRTMIISGKSKRMGRYEGRTSDWKKAIVRLPAGSVIKELEG